MSRFARFGARALMVLTLASAAVLPARAQQAASAQAPAPTAQAGPRVTEAMPRVQAAFKDDTPYRYKDHKTTITISTVVLVLAVVILVLVLI